MLADVMRVTRNDLVRAETIISVIARDYLRRA